MRYTHTWITASGLFGIQSLSYLVSLVLNVYLANILPAAAFGDFSIALRATMLVGGMLLLGSQLGAYRFLAKYIATNNIKQSKQYIRWAFRIFINSCVIFFLSLLMVFLLLGVLELSQLIYLKKFYHLAHVTLLLSPLYGLFLLLASFILSKQHYYASAFLNSFSFYLIMLITFFIYQSLYHPEWNETEVVVSMWISFLVLLGIEALFVAKCFPNLFPRDLKFMVKETTLPERQWLPTAVKLLMSNVCFFLFGLLELIILDAVYYHETIVGAYAAMLSVVSIIFLIGDSVSRYVKPLISSHFEYNQHRLQRILNETNLIQLLIGSAVTLSVVMFAQPILSFYNPQFSQFSLALQIMALGSLFQLMTHFAYELLSLTGHENHVLYSNLLAVLGLLIIGSLVTPYYGLLGITVTMVSIVSLKQWYLVIMVRRKLQIKSTLLG